MKLITALKGMGYSVLLDGENLRLRYLGTGPQPVEAQELIEELRDHKAEAVEYLRARRPLPHFDTDGGLVIPFDADPRFHYWAGGLSIAQTEREVRRWKH